MLTNLWGRRRRPCALLFANKKTAEIRGLSLLISLQLRAASAALASVASVMPEQVRRDSRLLGVASAALALRRLGHRQVNLPATLGS